MKTSSSSLIPFISLLTTICTIFGVPLLVGTLLFASVVISFSPILLIVGVAIAGGVTVTISISIACYVFFPNVCKKCMRRLRLWFVFLTPFHAVFLMILCLCFSFYWGLALGICVFMHGEVLWDRNTIEYRNQYVVDVMDRIVEPVLREYFPIRVCRDVRWLQNGDREKRHRRRLIFGFHPHGIYAFGLFTLVFRRSSGFDNIFPSLRAERGNRKGLLVGVASALLHVPVVHLMFSYLGFIPASRRTMKNACSSDHDVALIPGGIKEMFTSDSADSDIVYIKRRRGFVRLAISSGRDLVPVFSFGESRTFTSVKAFRSIREAVSRRFRVSLQLFHGRWFTLIPYRVPIYVVVGKPIDVSSIRDRLSQEGIVDEEKIVDEVHRVYVSELVALFNANKHLHSGYSRTKLVLT